MGEIYRATQTVPFDRGGHALIDRGTQLLTHRVALTTSFVNVQLAVDCKEIVVHFEGATSVGKIRGVLPGALFNLDNAAAVNIGGGYVELVATGHMLPDGTSVTIDGTTNYDGTYTLVTPSDANHIKFAATYVAETIPATATALGYRDAVITEDGSSVTLPIVRPATDKDSARTTVCSLAHPSATGTASILYWR